MREVKVFKWEQQEIDGKWKNLQVFDCIALFHGFGQEADGEGQSNPVAIVERADGKVQTIVAWMVEFVDCSKGVDASAALRDEFAGRAMQALIAKHGGYEDDESSPSAIRSFSEDAPCVAVVAEYAYIMADAMLWERAK